MDKNFVFGGRRRSRIVLDTAPAGCEAGRGPGLPSWVIVGADNNNGGMEEMGRMEQKREGGRMVLDQGRRRRRLIRPWEGEGKEAFSSSSADIKQIQSQEKKERGEFIDRQIDR